MSKTRQLALPLETHRNHYLFSDHFLNQVLPGQQVWRESEAEVRQALDAIAELYSRLEDALPHYNEAALEQEWIRPILDVLGHVYHVQPSLTGAAGTPDYAFFADDSAKQAAARVWRTPAFWETALAVGDAKRWDRPLDKRLVNGAPDAFTNANPCFQINYYLQRTGRTWGVLSNGRRWRLYYRETSSQLDIFYEVDLAQLIEQDDLAAFRYFYLFFRTVAFRLDAEDHCWLDEVLDQSAAYAVHVGDELKGRVYEALRLLAQGFLDYPTNQVFSGKPGLCPDPTTDLSPVHDGCLILLYRLLFLLYAESRGLLPLDNPSYAGQYSLKAIKEDIAHKMDTGVVYLAKKATLWDDLRTLFEIIYNGQESLGVPAYDGRLFDPARYPFLEERTIGDKYLAQAIDLLARAEAGPGQGLSFVDYRDLSIRHLGSIYEGLLEYRLAYATEEMAVVRRSKRGKKEEIVPASEAEKPGFFRKTRFLERIPAGQVYLVTDRGERKATGSYYTPDYIVKYIVEQTLGPLADSQAEAVEKEVVALKAKNKGGARSTQAYKDELTRLQNSFADRVLDLNTLDPAMGSGHFLVEATDYLARRIVEAGVVTEALANSSTEVSSQYLGGDDDCRAVLLTAVRSDSKSDLHPPQFFEKMPTEPVLSEVEGLTGAGDEESELSYWRRRVVERCIYGVDLNPLAVELAKLSLWLATVARGKPLSFLDHHLRCGNSLIGARVADLRALPVRKKRRRKARKGRKARKTSEVWETSEVSQLAMWDESAFTQDMYLVVGAMRQIGEYETADLVSVKEKERLFEETVERERRKWRTIADLWTATYFGLELTPQLYNACMQHVQGQPVLLQAAQAEALLDQAREIWGEKRFFHWEIEFPEVFFDEYGRHKGDAAGFDAVVGNPPYGASLSSEKGFLKRSYVTAEMDYDTYTFFTEQALDLLRIGGRHSFIMPSMWLTLQYNERLRRFVLALCLIESLLDTARVFEDATVETAILVIEKVKQLDTKDVKFDELVPVSAISSVKLLPGDVTIAERLDRIARSGWEAIHDRQQAKWWSNEFARFDYFLSESESHIVEQVQRASSRLGNLADVVQGLTAYDRYRGHSADLIKSRAYHADHKKDDTFKKFLQGSDVGRYELAWSGEWISYGPWLAAPRDPKFFRGPRLLFREVTGGANRPLATYTNEELYYGHSVIPALITDSRLNCLGVLAIINSCLLAWYNLCTSPNARKGAFPKMNPSDVAALPIRRIAFITPPEERERLVEDVVECYYAYLEHGEDVLVRAFVAARLMEEPERSDAVHDLLAHLAGRMIEMHKEKQAEVHGFLDWLAEYTGRPVDEWVLKTNLRRYYEQDWTEMGRILKRNQRKLTQVDLDVEAYKNEPAARIRAAWETSMETLRPLLAHIEATDRLIDQIVYQLYGLTEEEIAVVEPLNH